MKEKVCCILNEDENYAIRLTEYMNESRAMPYRTMAYTSVEALKKCNEKYNIEMLIADQELLNEAVKHIESHICIYLVEDESSSDYTVYKYQPTDQLIKAILVYTDSDNLYQNRNRRAKVTCIYSPVARTYKTTLALNQAYFLGKSSKTLYINLEAFAGLDEILTDNSKGISEAIYYFKTGKELAYGKIISCTACQYGFDYFYPAICADDLGDVTTDEIIDFLYVIINGAVYEEIVLDVGGIINKPWNLLSISDRIIMPEALDYSGFQKMKQFENYMHLSGKSDIADKIEKIKLPYIEKFTTGKLTEDIVFDETIQRIIRRTSDGF